MHIHIKIGKPYSYWFKMLYWVVFLKKIKNIWKPKQLFFRKTNSTSVDSKSELLEDSYKQRKREI